MRLHQQRTVGVVITTLALIALTFAPAMRASAVINAQQGEPPLAIIKSIIVGGRERIEASDAEIKVTRAGPVPARPVTTDFRLYRDDIIETFNGAKVTLLFLEDAVKKQNEIIIDENSNVQISSVTIQWGKLWAKVKGTFKTKTKTVRLGVEGTEYEVTQSKTEDRALLVVLDGIVLVEKLLSGYQRPEKMWPWDQPRPGRANEATALFLSAAFAPPSKPQTQYGRTINVESGQNVTYDGTYTLENNCGRRHQFEFHNADNSEWLSLAVDGRAEVDPGQSRPISVKLKIDATKLRAGAYRGRVAAKCLTCAEEPRCTQGTLSWPLQLMITSGTGPTQPREPQEPTQAMLQNFRVRELEEASLTKGTGQPVQTTEARVRSALEWTDGVILTTQPTYSAENLIPQLNSPDERSRKFRAARFDAIWRKDVPGSNETLGDIYHDWGQGARAVEAYDKELRVNSSRQNSDSLLANLGDAYRLTGQMDQAGQQIAKALSIQRSADALNADGNLQLDRARIARDKGNDNQAGDFLSRAQDSYQNSLQAPPSATKRNGANDSAIVAKSNLAEVYLAKGDIAQESNQTQEAIAQYRAAEQSFKSIEKNDPQYPFAITGLGKTYQGIGEAAQLQGNDSVASAAFAKAEDQHRQAIAAHPDFSIGYFNLGNLYERQGRADEAKESFRQAIKLRPEEPSAYHRLGVLLERENSQLAREYFQTYLQLERESFKTGQRADHARAVLDGRTVAVPNVLNLRAAEVRDVLARAQLRMGRITRQAGGTVDSTITSQNPRAGTTLAPGSSIDLIVSGKKEDDKARTNPIPDVINMTRSEAAQAIEAAGFKLGSVQTRASNNPAETIIEQNPRAKIEAASGTSIDLVVAAGGRLVKVPGVRGDSEEKAIKEIAKRNLVHQVRERSSCESIGKVLEQEPRKDSQVPTGSTVTIFVASAGEDAATMPNLIGLRREDAESVIRERGLRIRRVEPNETDRQQPGTIMDQKPKAETRLARECPVDLAVAVPVPLVAVPNFIGMGRREALVRASLAGFNVRTVDRVNDQFRGGSVMDQDPAPGSMVRRGSTVNLLIARPSEGEGTSQCDVDVPNVVGMPAQRAAAALAQYGLRAQAVGRGDTVVAQDPRAGTCVKRGAAVRLGLGSKNRGTSDGPPSLTRDAPPE